jgi:membrane associated rhomboid family serine protease
VFFFLPIDEGRPPKRFPLVNILLITLNIYVFMKTYSSFHFEQWVMRYGFIPAAPNLGSVVSAMFLHAGLVHLIGNMYFLYVFGDKVEDRLGRVTYLLTYFLCGFGAAFLQYSTNPLSTVPVIGASGAISGVCALYMVMFPWQKMRLQFFFLVFPVFSLPARAIFVVGIWFLEQYFMAVYSEPGLGGVAFWAHVGGFLSGLILFPFIYPGKNRKALTG